MKNKPWIIGTALLFSSAFFGHFDTFYGAEATTPGKYKMTYEVDGKVETAIIEVKENQTELLLKDSIITQHGKWSPSDNVVALKDEEGEPLNIKEVTIKNNVNVHEIGIYFVKFAYKNYTSVAKVSVNQFPKPDSKKRAFSNDSSYGASKRIMLNDELLKNQPTKQKMNLNTSGSGDQLSSSDFGNTLSFLSGTLLYGTRRV